ncbi:MAG: hypothetical protein HKN30_15470, partial [Sulfitobacter sp.]|nr:hypothetical protein [Sulfitobacter sp.]
SGRSGLTPIYVKRPRGPSVSAPGRNAVTFTINPSDLPPAQSQLSLTVDQPGATLKSNKARSFCRDAFTRSTK